MSRLIDALSGLFSEFRSGSCSEQERKIGELCMLLHLGMHDKVEAILQNDGSSASWDDVCSAVELTCGPGFVYTQHGVTRALSAWNEERQKVILERIVATLDRISLDFGASAYLTSGTLLGIIRENSLIPYDDDIDSAYVSKATDYFNWALEWVSLKEFLNQIPGCTAVAHLPGLLHVTLRLDEKSSIRFDVFSSIVEHGYLNEYPLDVDVLRIDSIEPLSRMDFMGIDVPVPADPEALLRTNYGDGWRKPDPKFRFDWANAGKQYGKRIVGMSGSLPTSSWMRDQLPVICGPIEQDTSSSSAMHYKIASLEKAFSLSDRRSILVVASEKALVAHAVALATEHGCTLLIVDLDALCETIPGDQATGGVSISDGVVDRPIAIYGGPEAVRATLHSSGKRFGTFFLGVCSRSSANTVLSTVSGVLADECHIVLDGFIPEDGSDISGTQYQALLHDDCLKGRALKALGRTQCSQVIFHATNRLVANYLI